MLSPLFSVVGGYLVTQDWRLYMDNERRSVRDDMAMAALTGLLANRTVIHSDLEWLAKESYRIADAMLAAR